MKRFITLLLAILYMTCLLSSAVTYRDAPPTDVPDYKQDDPRWADKVYSSHGDPAQVIKYHGCALCVIADMISYWFDPSITPVRVSQIAHSAGAVAYAGGTHQWFFDRIADYWPLTIHKTTDIKEVVRCLQNGGMVIASFNGGVWNPDPTKRHSCLIYAYSDGEFWLHDPGWSDPLLSQIIGHGSYDKIKSNAECFWCYQRERM